MLVENRIALVGSYMTWNQVLKYTVLQHSADEFERLLKEMCADEDGDLLIESAVKNVPKVFVVSTLVSVMPAQPFIFRNYQVQHFTFSFLVISVFSVILLGRVYHFTFSFLYFSCVSYALCFLFAVFCWNSGNVICIFRSFRRQYINFINCQ